VVLLGAFLLALFVVPSPWNVVLVLGAAAFEVAETWFFIRLSRRRRAAIGAETLLGARAEAISACRPEGQVRLAGEIWQARCRAGADRGDTVRVVGREGLTLVVEPERT
jgi:membrane-bound serine protease (ClpP class)